MNFKTEILFLIAKGLLLLLPIVVLIRDWKYSDKRTKKHHCFTKAIIIIWCLVSVTSSFFEWKDAQEKKDTARKKNKEILDRLGWSDYLNTRAESLKFRIKIDKSIDRATLREGQVYIGVTKSKILKENADVSISPVLQFSTFFDIYPATEGKVVLPGQGIHSFDSLFIRVGGWAKQGITKSEFEHVFSGNPKEDWFIFTDFDIYVRNFKVSDFNDSFVDISINERILHAVKGIEIELNNKSIFKLDEGNLGAFK